jgi:hypothetical protein
MHVLVRFPRPGCPTMTRFSVFQARKNVRRWCQWSWNRVGTISASYVCRRFAGLKMESLTELNHAAMPKRA